MESDLCFVVYQTPNGLIKLRIKGDARIPTAPTGGTICGIFEFDDPRLQIEGIYFEARETSEEGLREPFNVEQLLASLATP